MTALKTHQPTTLIASVQPSFSSAEEFICLYPAQLKSNEVTVAIKQIRIALSVEKEDNPSWKAYSRKLSETNFLEYKIEGDISLYPKECLASFKGIRPMSLVLETFISKSKIK